MKPSSSLSLSSSFFPALTLSSTWKKLLAANTRATCRTSQEFNQDERSTPRKKKRRNQIYFLFLPFEMNEKLLRGVIALLIYRMAPLFIIIFY
jgi:hypothetical protein